MNMSAHLEAGKVSELAQNRGDLGIWMDETGVTSWSEFGIEVERVRSLCLAAGVSQGSVVVTPSRQELGDLVWMFAIAGCGGIVAPLRPSRAAEAGSWARWFEVHWRVEEGCLMRCAKGATTPAAERLFEKLRSSGHPGLILATGGTSGKPKLVLHDLSALLATIPLGLRDSRRVLPLMRFDHIGGLDMAWRAMAAGHAIVAPPRNISADSVAQTVARHRVEVMAATPSLLNLLLMAGVHKIYDLTSLRTVPYGAEPMPDSLLARLRTALPGVDFVQRFGTSETGSLPVRAGRAGLELSRGHHGFEWRVVDNELHVRSPARALGYLTGETGGFEADGWFRTGDVAEEVSGGGIVVKGRRQDVINVGGEKVLPSEVEDLVLSHRFAEQCRVFGIPNALMGQVVAAEIVWRGAEDDPVAVKRALRESLPDEDDRRKLPTVVHLVDGIEFTRNLKTVRTAAP
jgi:acyl-CoA synthetase (AMP-forming)/AMP-acid ligase II